MTTRHDGAMQHIPHKLNQEDPVKERQNAADQDRHYRVGSFPLAKTAESTPIFRDYEAGTTREVRRKAQEEHPDERVFVVLNLHHSSGDDRDIPEWADTDHEEVKVEKKAAKRKKTVKTHK